MKLDWMIGILSVLLQKEKVTAPYIAEKLEISLRTVNRNIEALCAAGIPLITEPGRNGGGSGEVFEKRAASLPDLLRTAKNVSMNHGADFYAESVFTVSR